MEIATDETLVNSASRNLRECLYTFGGSAEVVGEWRSRRMQFHTRGPRIFEQMES